MPRRRYDHQPVDDPLFYRFKSFGYLAVMLGSLVIGLGVLSEGDQIALGFPAPQQFRRRFLPHLGR